MVILGGNREEQERQKRQGKRAQFKSENVKIDKALISFLLFDEPGVLKTRKESNSPTFTVNERQELRHKAILSVLFIKCISMMYVFMPEEVKG